MEAFSNPPYLGAFYTNSSPDLLSQLAMCIIGLFMVCVCNNCILATRPREEYGTWQSVNEPQRYYHHILIVEDKKKRMLTVRVREGRYK